MMWNIKRCIALHDDIEDAWEVTDTEEVGTFDIPDDVIENDAKLLEFLVEHEVLIPNVIDLVEVWGDCGCLEIREKEVECPLYYLFMVDYEPSTGHIVK